MRLLASDFGQMERIWTVLTSSRATRKETTLVPTHDSSGLGLGGRATGKFCVKVHHFLHASGILGSSDCLIKVSRIKNI